MTNLFRLKTSQGFVLKSLAEFFSSRIKSCNFRIDGEGMYLRESDTDKKFCADLRLPKENFEKYKYRSSSPLCFSINSNHLHKLFRAVKKKDCVSMFIHKNQQLQLGFTSNKPESSGTPLVTFINITHTQPENIKLPQKYRKPCIITVNRFQSLKNLQSCGPKIKLTRKGRRIFAFADGEQMYSRRLELTEPDDDSDDDEDDKEDVNIDFQQTFNTSVLLGLCKCSGNTGSVSFWFEEDSPLQIKILVGTLGYLTVYIKSDELIEKLEEIEENEEEEENEGKDDDANEEDELDE
jgi:hypothetical protein